MPTYEIQAPNGKTYRIDGPEGASDDQIRAEVARQFPEAVGTSKAVAKQGDITAEYDVPANATPEQIQALSREAIARANPGAQFGDPSRDTVQINQPGLGETLVNSAADVSSTVAKGFFGGLEFLSTPGRIVNEAMGDARRFVVTGGRPTTDPSRNALADFLDPGMGPKFSESIDRLNPSAASSPSAFASEVLGGLLIPGPKTAKAPTGGFNALTRAESSIAARAANPNAQLVADAERAGVRIMTSDMKQPKTFVGKGVQKLGEIIPVVGTGPVRAKQQAERIDAVKNVALEYGADDVADDVAADLAKTRGDRIKTLKGTKDRIINNIGGEVSAPQAIKAIDEQIANLNGINAKAYAPLVSKLEDFKEVLSSGKSLAQIEGNRKLLGDLFKNQNLAEIAGDGQTALNAIYGPLRADMGAFIRSKGGESAYKAWKDSNDELAAMAGELKNNKLKSVLRDAESTPETVSKLLFSRNPSDVKRLYSNLSPEGRVKAQSALLHKALSDAGVKSIDELDAVNPDSFVRAMERYGKSTGVVFDPADKARLDGLARVLQTTQRASKASVMTDTGQQLLPWAVPPAFITMFGDMFTGAMAAGTVGVIARIYESAPVRNALLKLGRTKPGSPQERTMLDRAARSILMTVERTAPVNDNIPLSPGMAAAQEPAPSGGEPPQQ